MPLNSTDFNLHNKCAVVTGGASGIGQSISTLFAEKGATVYILDIDESKGSNIVNEIAKNGGIAFYHNCDITVQNDVLTIFDKIYKEEGSLDILLNNAGIAFIGNIEQTTEQDLDRLYNVNIKGAYNCALAAIRHMKKKNSGCIINMASAASSVGLADRFAYSMTKGAILTMTYSIAKDYLDYNIRCNSISPGRVHTPFVDKYLRENYPGNESEMFEKLSKTQPLGRMGKPDEIAGLALYLSSDAASFITGSNFPIDGGFVTLNT